MKYFKFVLFSIGIVVFTSCQPPVVFGEAQPVGIKPLTEIPSDYQGIYWCKVDSVSLFVDDKTFIKRKEFLIKMTRSEIDSNNNLELVNGRLFVKDLEIDFPADEIGDTIISSLILRDTIFAIRPQQVLKPYKGHLVINTKLNENTWSVLLVSHKSAGTISLARAEIPENFAQLDSITTLKTLTKLDGKETQIYLTPTAEQFGRILDQGLLFGSSCSQFEPIIPFNEHIY
jgi:hypothetical protein